MLSNVVISTKMKDNGHEKRMPQQDSAKEEEIPSSIGFLKGNPLLERIKYFTQSRRSWPERWGSIILILRYNLYKI